MATLGTPERVALIKENLAEVLDFKIIEDILAEGRNPKIYWGQRLLVSSLLSRDVNSFQALRQPDAHIADTLYLLSKSHSTSPRAAK
jgi:hypothetical protein